MSEQSRPYQKFTKFELLIGAVLLAGLAAVVVPEFTHAGALSRSADLSSAVEVLRGEVGKYRIEHQNHLPGYRDNQFDSRLFWRQLTTATDEQGEPYVRGVSRQGPFGPYLENVVANPVLETSAGRTPPIQPVMSDSPTPVPGAQFYFDVADGSGKIWAATDENGTVSE